MMEVAPAVVAQLPTRPGVYRFRDEGGSVLYLGRAADLRRRVRSYWSERGDRPWLARMVPRITRVEVAVCDSTHEAAWLEASARRHVAATPAAYRDFANRNAAVTARINQAVSPRRCRIVEFIGSENERPEHRALPT